MANNARKTDETLEQYHARLKQEQAETDAKLQGQLFWNTTEQGTYIKPTPVT